jgi:hypothetical protein
VKLDLSNIGIQLMSERGGQVACTGKEIEEETRHLVSSMMSGLDFT